ncbi:MAG: zf-HC2 domain-containing protein [Acidobacteria bacterium]|nr:zf-HC2 domain-containing protein [Acidobacteriota bacterium]
MSCEEIRPFLEAYVDGEIAPETRDDVTRHLDGCVSCHREAQSLFALAAEARETLGSVEPARDLWPGVARHIASAQRFESRRKAHSAWWLAAAALIGVAVGAALMLQRQPPTEAVASRGEPAASLEVTLASWEQEILQHRTALLASLDRQRDRLPAESIRTVEENLLLIDEAIREIRSALAKDPDNPKLNFLLASAYQQEVQLLKRLSNV